MGILLDGIALRDRILEELATRAEAVTAALGRPPGLGVILAGHNPASEVYVRNKTRTAQKLSLSSETLTPPNTVSTGELISLVDAWNHRSDIDAILVQLPLPPQVDAQQVLLAVHPSKDVDGFHPTNVGNLATGRPGPKPCTPAGIMELLKRYEIPISGKRAVIVGRSDIVGKPAALLLLQENATVTIAHSKTQDLPSVCREADILVAAIGRPAFLGLEHVKPGAAVIDVGINRVEGKLVGDVDPAVREVAGAWTPVPGGVGPLTIAMLMKNTIEAAERAAAASR